MTPSLIGAVKIAAGGSARDHNVIIVTIVKSQHESS